jgi:ornithine decarboxylase
LVNEFAATAEWPLSKKFGCEIPVSKKLFLLAKELGLEPVGVSFHVGSQQKNINAWNLVLEKVKDLFCELETNHGMEMTLVNIGGGLPAHYMADVSSTKAYAETITKGFEANFGKDFRKKIKVIIEPGRSLAGNAGVLTSEVILITPREKQRWVYVDVGRFSGLAETEGESIKYLIYREKQGEKTPCVVAGPTCDGADILYREYQPLLPDTLERGDRVFFLSTGAYTATYSAVEFNGFPPLSNDVFFVR